MADFNGKFWARGTLPGIGLAALMLGPGPSIFQAVEAAPPGTPPPAPAESAVPSIPAVHLSSPPIQAPVQTPPGQPAPASEEGVSKRELPALRMRTPPRIDGDLSDPAWQQAAKAERFTDRLTVKPAQDQTIAYLGYDDQNI